MKRLAIPVAAMVIGAAGLSLIKESEGLRSNVYLDPVGIPTVCYGHTGPDVKLGQPARGVRQCDALLNSDISVHLGGVKACLPGVQLNQNQQDAVVSFAINLGVARTCSSTLAAKLRLGDNAGASREFQRWVYAGGKVYPGLVTRRAREAALFNTPVAPPEGASGPQSAPTAANIGWAIQGDTN